MSDFNYELLRSAVVNGDLESVRLHLSAGAGENVDLRSKLGSFLLLASDVEIIKELLSRGAYVNEKNSYGETPLHLAVTNPKVDRRMRFCFDSQEALPRVRVLLMHGAEVNACENDDLSVLYTVVCAIEKRIMLSKRFSFEYNCDREMEVVKELLDYGADINLKSIGYNVDRYSSPLGLAVKSGHLPLIKMLIKYALLNRSNADHKQIVNLDPFVEEDNFSAMSHYFDECVLEIVKMKTDNFCHYYHSLYSLVANKRNSNKIPICCHNEIEVYISSNYPVCHDVILPRLKECIERGNLFEKLKNIQICTVSRSSQRENEVILIPDCIVKIGEYLSKNDLLNFIEAFDESY